MEHSPSVINFLPVVLPNCRVSAFARFFVAGLYKKLNQYMKINKCLQLCFQNTTIKMIIFCACKNLLNNKRSLKEYRNHCAKRP